jgi:beta-xylosidase
MGVPISGPSYVFGDNMSVIHNTQRPESTLKKKGHQICYHFCRESVAMGESLTAHIRSEDNVGDLATKVIYAGSKRDHLVSQLLHDILPTIEDDDPLHSLCI